MKDFYDLLPLIIQLKDSETASAGVGIIKNIVSCLQDEYVLEKNDIDRLKDYSRFLFLLKNNDGVSNKVIPLYFNGASSYFKELEQSNKITEKYYKELNL